MPVTSGGVKYAFDASPGVGYDDAIIQSSGNPSVVSAAGDVAGAASTPKVSTLWYFFGIIALIIALKFSMEHEKSGMDPQLIGIGVFNLLSVTFMALIGFILLKTILNKYNVPGLTDLVNAS